MGIKSGLDSVRQIYVGGTPVSEVYHGINLVFSLDKGDLSLWRYSNEVIEGKTLLYEYRGAKGNATPVRNAYFGSIYAVNSYLVGYLNYGRVPTVGEYVLTSDGKKSDYVIDTIYNQNSFKVHRDYGSDEYNLYREPSFDAYNMYLPNTLYVPKVGGRTVLNDYRSTYPVNTPFYNRPYLTNVDLQEVPFRNNNMCNAFYNCSYLTSVQNIPNSTTVMSDTFNCCYNFNQNVRIPSSVTNMYDTFGNCYNLNQNVQIPNGVSNMNSTFKECHNLNQNIRIPNSVTDMSYTFSYCNNLNQNIRIPNAVNNMCGTFSYCKNLNQNIHIPNSVASMIGTFRNCNGLKWIYIHSANINTMSVCFNSTNNNVHVIIPSRYINNAISRTYTSLDVAGWKVTNEGALVGSTGNKIYGWDMIQGDYPVYTANSTHWVLSKWSGNLTATLRNNSPLTDVIVPEYFTTYDTFPSALNYPCFRANTTVTSVDFGCEIPWVGNKMGSGTNESTLKGAFQGCKNLMSCRGVINNSVTSVNGLFHNCFNLAEIDVIFPDSPPSYYSAFAHTSCPYSPPIGGGATNLQSMFWNAKFLRTAPVIPSNVTSMVTTFANGGQSNLTGNILILSPNVSNITNTFRSPNTSLKKDIYIYYKYSNGVNTTTYNKFVANNWFIGSGVSGSDPMFNTTSNFYLHDITNAYNSMWEYDIYLAPSLKRFLLKKYKGSLSQVAMMANYPDWKADIFDSNCFNNCSQIQMLSLYDAEILVNNETSSCSNLFRNCTRLYIVQGLNLNKVKVPSGVTVTNVNLYRAFENCYNLKVMSSIPSCVESMNYTFRNCYNFDFNVQIKEGVSSTVGAFSGCRNLNRNIKIPNTVINMSDTFYGCYNLNQNIQIPVNVTNMKNTFYSCRNLYGRINVLSDNISNASNCFTDCYKFKEVHIPYKYANGVNSKTFNSFVSAGYMYNNGVSTGRNNTIFYDLSY